MGEKCKVMVPCKLATMEKKFECEGNFKGMMASIRNEEVDAPQGVTASSAG